MAGKCLYFIRRPLQALLFFLALGMMPGKMSAQTSAYQLTQSESVSSSIVRLTLKIYCTKKKIIDAEAQYAAIRIALFDGCPNTPFNKPLLEDGEATSFQQHPEYFDNLYNYRLPDFISACIATSDFKKGDKNKATIYEVDVKVLQLRKDLEKNNIRRKMGL